MAGFRIELNKNGVGELLRAPGVLENLIARGQRVQSAAGPGHRLDVGRGSAGGRGAGGRFAGNKRARVAVIAETFEARRREAKSRVLTRAFYAARG